MNLTLDSAVDIALGNSYSVRQLQLGIERTRSYLEAQQAGLKSNAYMQLTTPEIEAVSDNKWNSTLQRYEIVQENTRMWQMHTAIRQPVVLLGYPTNGHLSLNNTMYRYAQLNNGLDVKYYNRYFLKYEQPFFQPNSLKNNIEEAELDLEQEELDFRRDIVNMIDDIADDYYQLFELSYEGVIYSELVEDLAHVERVVHTIAEGDTSRTIELNQVQVELANARERLNQARSEFRLEASRMKQRLRLDDSDSIYVEPTIEVSPIDVDLEKALQYGHTLRPRMRRLEISRRQRELDLENAKGWNSFRVNLEATVGREMQDPRLSELWGQPTNSYSVGLNVYIPIWDWGRHESQVDAREISLQKTELYIEETRQDIRSEIKNAIQNLEEYEERALTMQENVERARQIANASLKRYQNGQISILDLLQSYSRQQETSNNFLDAYLGYRRALMSLQEDTYYDFENGTPLFDRFDIDELAGIQQ